MKTRLTILALVLLASSPAEAYSLRVTPFPSHWLLDKGSRVIHIDPNFYSYEPSLSDKPSPSLAVPIHMETEAEAVAKARAQSKLCLPVRVTTDDGAHYHAPSECH